MRSVYIYPVFLITQSAIICKIHQRAGRWTGIRKCSAHNLRRTESRVRKHARNTLVNVAREFARSAKCARRKADERDVIIVMQERREEGRGRKTRKRQ